VAFHIFGVRLGRKAGEPALPSMREQRSLWSLPGGWGYSYPVGGATEGLSQALLNSASYACIDVLVDHASAAPLDAVRYLKGGGRQQIEPLPVLLRDPSGIVTPDIWRAQLIFALVTDGNAFGQILAYDRNGKPTQVEWVPCSTVTKREVVGGFKQVTIDNRVHRCFPFGDIVHIPGRMVPDYTPFALSPLEHANNTIGTSLSAQHYTSSWFTGGGHPSMEIIVEGLSSAEQAMEVKGNYQSMVRTGEPWVHGDGISSKAASEKPDMVAVDVMWQAASMVCQIWHVPPTWIYVSMANQGTINYQNVAQADIAGLKDSVDVFFRRIEGALSPCLTEPYIVRVNRDAVLRLDAPTRVDVQAKRLENKLMSVNEGRAQEDEAPWPDPVYDEPGLPAAPAPVVEPESSNDDGGGSDAAD